MTDADKSRAFDTLCDALANRWYDGSWSWFCQTPSGGPKRMTRREAIADLVAWADRAAKENRNQQQRPTAIPLPMVVA